MESHNHYVLCVDSILSSDSLEWGSLPCKEAPPRNSHAVVLHENNMVIIGGASPDGQTDDVHIIDLSDLSNLTCRQVDCQTAEKTAPHSESFQRMPAAREMHSACLCSLQTTKDRDPIILVMGGRSVTGVHRDLFSLNTGGSPRALCLGETPARAAQNSE